MTVSETSLVGRLRAKHIFGNFEIEAQRLEAAETIERLTRERDDLLNAAGFKPGSLDSARDVILDDIAGMRPAMVEARRRQQDAESDAILWQMYCAETEFDSGETLLLRVWKQRRAAVKRALTAVAQRDGAYEECAKIAENFYNVDHGHPAAQMIGQTCAEQIASAIRAARQKPDQ